MIQYKIKNEYVRIDLVLKSYDVNLQFVIKVLNKNFLIFNSKLTLYHFKTKSIFKN